MNKLALALIFSTIVFIKGTATVNYYNTEPYHSFDWLDDDENKFKIEYTEDSLSNYFCFLYNQSVACKTTCTDSSSTLECTLKGNDCKADGDNPAYKYYYSTYCVDFSTLTGTTFIDPDDNTKTKSITLTKDSDSATVLKYIKTSSSVIGSSNDVQVTIAVSNGSFLKYSMILLSLLIL